MSSNGRSEVVHVICSDVIETYDKLFSTQVYANHAIYGSSYL